MNRLELIFVSLVALFLGLIMIVVGSAWALSPYFSLPLRALAIFKMGPLAGGIFVTFVGLSLLLAFYTLNRHRYLRFKSDGYSISEEALTTLAERSLRERFPNCSCDVTVFRGSKIEVTANIVANQEELDQIEEILQKTFARACGFKEPFTLNLRLLN